MNRSINNAVKEDKVAVLVKKDEQLILFED